MTEETPEVQPETTEENESASKTPEELMEEYSHSSGLFKAMGRYFSFVFELPDEVIASEEGEKHVRASAKKIAEVMTGAIGGQYFLEKLVVDHPLGPDLSDDEYIEYIKRLKSHVRAFFNELKTAIPENRKKLFDEIRKG